MHCIKQRRNTTNFTNAHRMVETLHNYVGDPSDLIISPAVKFWTKAK